VFLAQFDFTYLLNGIQNLEESLEKSLTLNESMWGNKKIKTLLFLWSNSFLFPKRSYLFHFWLDPKTKQKDQDSTFFTVNLCFIS